MALLVILYFIYFISRQQVVNQPRLPEIKPKVIYIQGDFEEKQLIEKFIDISSQLRFDWKLTVAVAQLETILCKATVGKNNCFNLTNGKGGFLDFYTKEDSAIYFINLLQTSPYYKEFQSSGKVDDLFRYAEDIYWRDKIKILMNRL